jgi:hypothetical protein
MKGGIMTILSNMWRFMIVGLAVSGVIWMILSMLGWGLLFWVVLIAIIGEGYRAITT